MILYLLNEWLNMKIRKRKQKVIEEKDGRKMKTIMLVCSAGMSTSLLVSKMKAAADEKGVEADIFAISSSEATELLNKKSTDVLLLGPQVRFMKAQFEKETASKNIPVEVIDMRDYGLIDGLKVLNTALELIGE